MIAYRANTYNAYIHAEQLRFVPFFLLSFSDIPKVRMPHRLSSGDPLRGVVLEKLHHEVDSVRGGVRYQLRDADAYNV